MLVVVLLCVGVGAQRWDDAEYEGAARHDNDDVDFDDYYDEEDLVSPTTVTLQDAHAQTSARVRRYGDRASVARTLSADEIREVKGALKELMSGRNVKEPTSTTEALRTTLERATTSPPFTGLTRSSHGPTRSIKSDPTKYYEDIIQEIIEHARRHSGPTMTSERRLATRYQGFPTEETEWPILAENKTVVTENSEDSDDIYGEKNELNNCTYISNVMAREHKTVKEMLGLGPVLQSTRDGMVIADYIFTSHMTSTTRTRKRIATRLSTSRPSATPLYRYTTTVSRDATRTRRTRRKTTTTSTPKEVIDIETLVEIIANLTLDYELINITDLFNKTLLSYKIPKCLAPLESTTTSTTTMTTTEDPWKFTLANATVVSKCFVCGLDIPGIPSNAWCADAFAGDFLPLVPVDPIAKGQIARYRKYCRFLDVPGVLHNATQPRSVYGRFTGGCSVRWVDLTGVYTQRACRNRRRAVMGQHFVSKRMAKLEMALTNVDNGCIISPMSSLVPLSRGISLYARFHACVCTGNWCNQAVAPRMRRVPAAPALAWALAGALLVTSPA